MTHFGRMALALVLVLPACGSESNSDDAITATSPTDEGPVAQPDDPILRATDALYESAPTTKVLGLQIGMDPQTIERILARQGFTRSSQNNGFVQNGAIIINHLADVDFEKTAQENGIQETIQTSYSIGPNPRLTSLEHSLEYAEDAPAPSYRELRDDLMTRYGAPEAIISVGATFGDVLVWPAQSMDEACPRAPEGLITLDSMRSWMGRTGCFRGLAIAIDHDKANEGQKVEEVETYLVDILAFKAGYDTFRALTVEDVSGN